jgi:hypothetical protein
MSYINYNLSIDAVIVCDGVINGALKIRQLSVTGVCYHSILITETKVPIVLVLNY